MIDWNNYPDFRPPVGVPILVWFRGAVCVAEFELEDKKWVWWITYYDELTKYGWGTERRPEADVSYWSEANQPPE